MSVIFFIFLIGAVNLCLGYALAVRLGYHPRNPTFTRRVAPVIDTPKPRETELVETTGTPLADLIEELLGTPIDESLEDELDFDPEAAFSIAAELEVAPVDIPGEDSPPADCNAVAEPVMEVDQEEVPAAAEVSDAMPDDPLAEELAEPGEVDLDAASAFEEFADLCREDAAELSALDEPKSAEI